MVLIEIDSMMMLTTSVTATTRMLPVLSNATVSMANVATKFASLSFVMARHSDLIKPTGQ